MATLSFAHEAVLPSLDLDEPRAELLEKVLLGVLRSVGGHGGETAGELHVPREHVERQAGWQAGWQAGATEAATATRGVESARVFLTRAPPVRSERP